MIVLNVCKILYREIHLGEKWHEMRATLSPSFTSKKMKMLFSVMDSYAVEFIDYFSNESDVLREVDAKDIFTRYTNDIIATSAFGVKCNSMKERNNEFYVKGRSGTNFTGFWITVKMFFMLSVPRFSKVHV